MWDKVLYNDWHLKLAETILARDTQIHARWAYDDGVVMNGFAALYDLTGEKRYFEYIKRVIDSFLLGGGAAIRDYSLNEYNIDHINNGKLLLYLCAKTGEAKYRRAADLLRSQLRTHPRTGEGGFWHKQIYPFQMWLDGLYMGAPFYTRYAVMFGELDAFADVARQFRLSFQHTLDEKTGLHYHAWDEKRAQFWCDKETGCSENFWGRAMGWYVAAMVDVLEFFPEPHPDRAEIIGFLNACATALLNVQDEKTGVWYQVLDQGTRPGNYLEASCSCLFVYALAKGIRNGWLPPSVAPRVRRAYEGIITQFVELYKGQVDLNKCCQVAGLGNVDERDGTFAYYMREPIIANDPKGVGAFLQAAVEVEGLKSLGG